MLSKLPNENEILSKLEKFLVAKLLPAAAQEQYNKGDIGKLYLQPLADALKILSSEYVDQSIKARQTATAALAYAFYFLPINFVKVLRTFQHCSILAKQTIKVLDFGCGPGTASLAALNYFDVKELVLIEKDQAMINVAKELLPANTSSFQSISEIHSNCFDLIICANSINELADTEKTHVLNKLASLLTPSGTFIIIEPALKNITRDNMQLRDWITSNTDLKVTYPCTHSNPCPMLNINSDWCHTELNWEPPNIIRQLDRLTGFNKHKLKTSVFIFSRNIDEDCGTRVVNFPKKSKKGIQSTLCGKDLFSEVFLNKTKYKRVKNYSYLDSLGDSEN